MVDVVAANNARRFIMRLIDTTVSMVEEGEVSSSIYHTLMETLWSSSTAPTVVPTKPEKTVMDRADSSDELYLQPGLHLSSSSMGSCVDDDPELPSSVSIADLVRRLPRYHDLYPADEEPSSSTSSSCVGLSSAATPPLPKPSSPASTASSSSSDDDDDR